MKKVVFRCRYCNGKISMSKLINIRLGDMVTIGTRCKVCKDYTCAKVVRETWGK